MSWTLELGHFPVGGGRHGRRKQGREQSACPEGKGPGGHGWPQGASVLLAPPPPGSGNRTAPHRTGFTNGPWCPPVTPLPPVRAGLRDQFQPRREAEVTVTRGPGHRRGGGLAPPPGPHPAPRGTGAHQWKSESWQGHTRAASADVKFLPLMHSDAAFLLRKLLRWPMRQRPPCGGGTRRRLSPFMGGDAKAQGDT